MKKNETIQETFAQLKKYHIDGFKQLDELPETKNDIISTGIVRLDMALGVGGIRNGSIIEIYAPESSGKTTLALHLCKQYQKANKPVLYIDSERTLTRETVQRLGIKNDNFYVSNVNTLEEALEVCKISANTFGVIVIDSLAGLTPKAQADGYIGDSHVGLFSRIMSEAFPVLVPILANSGCTLIITNQLRENVGVMFGNPERVPGGRALKYYATIRLDIRRIESLRDGDREIVGNRTRVKVVKNKIAPPFKEAEFDIMFKDGISVEGDLLDLAAENNVINKNGAWYIYEGNQIGLGRENAKKYLRENPKEMKKIADKLRKCI